VDGLINQLDQRGREQADQVTHEGVDIAVAAGWSAKPRSVRSIAGEGLELARLAEELHPDAVIVGARGLSGVRAMLGSVSDAVVHYSPVPVLVVPPTDSAGPRRAQPEPVLVAYDGSAGADVALTSARALWPTRPLVVASVGCQAAEELPADRNVETAVLQLHGVADSARAVADALAEHAGAIGSAVIVIGSRGRSAHREILLGSVAMATLHHAHRPVLAVPPPNRLALSPHLTGADAAGR
jgi:nucleotide-binding universal stress UspA family protein